MERYQTGSLEKRKSSLGLCWFIRFRERDGDNKKRPRTRVGLLADYPTKAAARRAAEQIRQEFNAPGGTPKPKPALLFRDLVSKYEAEEMPERYSTSQSYKSMVKVHILPKWGSMPVDDVRPQDVRTWLLGLRTLPRKPGAATRPLAPKSRSHIKGLMSVLFRYAAFLGCSAHAVNPMTLFTISAQRKKEPRILSMEEFRKLVEKMTAEPFRTMVITAGCLGLSCSELIGIRWEDIDWIGKVDGPRVHIRTGVVNGREGGVKNSWRKKPLPLSPLLLIVLQEHRGRAEFKEDDDWVFASPYKAGETPYDPGEVRKKYIAKAVKDAGLGDGIGWHTFRHSYRAWLGDSGAKMELQRDLMRHSNISTTMDIYGSTFPEGLRDANHKVVEGLLQ